jgi:hypothetical protein
MCERLLGLGLTPKELRLIKPETITGFQFFGPIKLNLSVHNTPPEAIASLLAKLSKPHFLDPYNRWEWTRKVINPLWLVGSGFEGHLIGLPQKVVLERLEEYERSIQRLAKRYGFQPQLTRFIKKPDSAISAGLAREGLIIFEILLARARAERTMLQKGGCQANSGFQKTCYSSIPMVAPRFSFDQTTGCLTIGAEKIPPAIKSSKPLFSDDIRASCNIKDQFPFLSEIGRFGFPPVKLILSGIKE